MRIRFIFGWIFLCVISSLYGQDFYRVFPVHYNDSVSDCFKQGFFYNLPQNYLILTVNLHKTSKYAGPFSEYAERLLGLSGAIKENETEYAIGSIELSLQSQVDTSKTYWVEYPSKMSEKFMFTPEQAHSYSWHFDFPVYNEQTKARFEMYDNYTLIEKIDTSYETKEIDSNIYIVPKYHKKMVEKTTAQKAEEAMQKIKKIREAQWLLLTGDYDVDFSNLKYMISELKQEEETYLSLFSGFSISEEESYSFVITLPCEKKEFLVIHLFDFSSQMGVAKKIAGNDVESYTLQLANQHYTDIKANVIQKQLSKKQQGSFYYRIPEYYSAMLYKQNQAIKSMGLIPVSQYGVEHQLPKNVISFKLNPLTGEVGEVEFSK